MKTSPPKKASPFRKQLILPSEHGSWAWLLVPFFVGVGIGSQMNTAVFLTLVSGLALFLLRQPATIWLRARQGRARKSDQALALKWVVGFSLAAFLCLIGLLWQERAALLWLAAPLLVVFLVSLLVVYHRPAAVRSLGMELIGAGSLAVMAPAALVAVNGRITPTAFAVWGLMAGQNILGALYVRLRIADTHQRPMNRAMIWGSHALGLTAVGAASLVQIVPWPTLVPFVGFLIRASWTFPQPRPIPHIKRFGFTEIGIEILSGAWIVASYTLIGQGI